MSGVVDQRGDGSCPVNVITKKNEAIVIRWRNSIEQPLELIQLAAYIADGD